MNDRMRVGLLLVVAILVYANTLANGFTYDDQAYILHNPVVRHPSLTGFSHPMEVNNVFRPIYLASFALNWGLGQAEPFGYHLFNVLLQAAVVVLLYLLLKVLLESSAQAGTIAFVTALLFAVHPIHTEAVASIVGRSELLAVGFLLAAWLLHLHDREVPSLLCFLLALLSKESAVVFVPLVVLGDYARDKLKPVLRYAWVASLAAFYLAAFWKIEGGRWGEKRVIFLDNPLASLPAAWRVLNALRIAWKYVGLHVYPATLSCDYSYNAISLYANWRHTLPAAAGAVFVLALWIWAVWTRRSAWLLAGSLYLVAFSVTANILVPTGTIMGERLAYLPSAGFCLLVALLWVRLEERKRTFAWAVLSLLLVALATRTLVRNRDWRNNFTLFSTEVKAVPGNARAHSNLAAEYAKLGELDVARVEYQAALRILPEYPDAIENYALLKSRMGDDQDALRLFQRALYVTPSDRLDYPWMVVNLAVQLMKLGQNDEALNILSQIIQQKPDLSPAWSNRAVIYRQRGEFPSARSDAETALRLDPTNQQAQFILSVLNAAVPPRQGVSSK